MSIQIDANDKLGEIPEPQLSTVRRKQPDDIINSIEKSSFTSINFSLGWIGTSASPLCSYYSSYLQQKESIIPVCNMKEQINILRRLKKHGTTICYRNPSNEPKQSVSVLAFTDASKFDEVGQLAVVVGLLICGLKKGSIYHIVSWLSHKIKRPVKSVPAAEIFAAAEGIDEGKMVAKAYSELLYSDVKLELCVYSKDLFSSISTERNSMDRSIRDGVIGIRFEFQTGAVHKIITWIPGKVNSADPLKKKDIVLSEALELTMFNGILSLELEDVSETKSSEKNFG